MARYRVRILATAQGERVQNVFHVVTNGTNQAGTAVDMANAWRARFLPLLSNTYAFQGAEVEDIDTDQVGAYSPGTTGPTVGGSAAAPLPTWACVSVRLQTSLRGRAGQGRMGFSPIGEDSTGTQGNYLAADHVTAWSTQMAAFVTDIASSGDGDAGTLAVVSYYKGKGADGKPLKRPAPVVTLVDTVAVNTALGTRLSRHPSR